MLDAKEVTFELVVYQYAQKRDDQLRREQDPESRREVVAIQNLGEPNRIERGPEQDFEQNKDHAAQNIVYCLYDPSKKLTNIDCKRASPPYYTKYLLLTSTYTDVVEARIIAAMMAPMRPIF